MEHIHNYITTRSVMGVLARNLQKKEAPWYGLQQSRLVPWKPELMIKHFESKLLFNVDDGKNATLIS